MGGSCSSSGSSSSSSGICRKILVFGPRFAGKSTFVRQLALKRGKESISKAERIRFAAHIRKSIVDSLRKLCEETEFAGGLIAMSPRRKKFGDSSVFTFKAESKVFKDGFLKFCDEDHPQILEFKSEVVESIKKLWADSAIQNCLTVLREKGKHLDIISERFFSKIDEIASRDYVPDDDDIVQSYVQIPEVTEFSVSLGKRKYKVVDPGTSEEQKILIPPSSDDLAAAVFMFDISEYNRPSTADLTITNTEEALRLFERLCESESIRDLPILLLLNKKDMFDVKAEVAPAFNDSVIDYLKEEFLKKASFRDVPVRIFVTEATDLSSLDSVVSWLKDPEVKACE